MGLPDGCSRTQGPVGASLESVAQTAHSTRSRSNPGGIADVLTVLGPDVQPHRGRKPPWFKVPAPGGPQYRELQQLIIRGAAAHGLPGGRLPEHRRVLAAGHGHVHDPRRHVHAPVRLLQRQDRASRRGTIRSSRPGWRASVAKMGLRHAVITQRRPRRPPGLRRQRLRRRHQTDQTPVAEHQDRGAHARLPRLRDAAGQGDRRAPGRVQPQRRGRAAPLPGGPPGLHLGALQAGAPERQGVRG